MVSQKLYYERKAAGLCTKCGGNLEGSPSTTRCSICYQKFLLKQNNKKDVGIKNRVCIGCQKNSSVGNSNYCNSCRQKSLTTTTNQPIVSFKEENTLCKVCNQNIDTLGILCKKCLANTSFTKIDAISRYGNKCLCGEDRLEVLRIISKDISDPMKHHGPNLYKIICFNTTPPKEYKISCYECYWKMNLDYIQELRQLFDKTPLADEKEDIININYEDIDDSNQTI